MLETCAVVASDDEGVPEYDVHQDDEPELEMIVVADESQKKGN